MSYMPVSSGRCVRAFVLGTTLIVPLAACGSDTLSFPSLVPLAGACAGPSTSFKTSANAARAVEWASGMDESSIDFFKGLFMPAESASSEVFKLASQIAGALELDARNMQKVTTSLDEVYDCRAGEAKRIRALASAGELEREAANEQIAELRRDMASDVALAREVLGSVEERRLELRTETQVARNSASTDEERQEVARAEEALQTNQQVYRASTEEVRQIEVAASGDDLEEIAFRLPDGRIIRRA